MAWLGTRGPRVAGTGPAAGGFGKAAPARPLGPSRLIDALDEPPFSMFDDFTGTNGAAWNATNWVNSASSAGATQTIQTNRGRLGAGSATAFAGKSTMRFLHSPTTDLEITGTVQSVSAGNDDHIEIWFRAGSTTDDGANGYLLQIDHNGHQMAKLVAFSFTMLGTGNTALSVGSGVDVSFRIQNFGQNVRYKVWLSSGAEPGTWAQDFNDTSFSAGYVHFHLSGGNAAGAVSDFDNISIANFVQVGVDQVLTLSDDAGSTDSVVVDKGPQVNATDDAGSTDSAVTTLTIGPPGVLQEASGASSASSTSVVATLPGAATAGNFLVVGYGMDKAIGTPTPPSGWTPLFSNSSASVSMWVGYKVAAGGETAATFARGNASASGDSWYIAEMSQGGTGAWSILDSASNFTTEATVTSTASGTTGALTQDGTALAFFAIDSGSSSSTSQSFSGGYTARSTWANSGAGGMAVGMLAVSTGATPTTTHTHAPTADQVSGAIVAFARIASVNWVQTPTDSAGSTDSAAITSGLVLSDIAGASDALAVASGVVSVDAAGSVDTSVVSVGRGVVAVDSAGSSDSLTVVLSIVLSVTDDGGSVDSAAILRSLVATDSAGSTDSAALLRAVVALDSAGSVDSAALGYSLAAVDNGGLTDFLSQSLSSGTTLTPTDLAGSTDSASVSRGAVFSDSAGSSDALSVTSSRGYVDSAGSTDSLSVALSKVFTDLTGATDSLLTLVSRSFTDAAGSSDAAVVSVGKGVTAEDDAGSSDDAVVSVGIILILTDDAGSSDDSLVTGGSHGDNITIIIVVGERRIRASVAPRSVSGSVDNQRANITINDRRPTVALGTRRWSVRMDNG